MSAILIYTSKIISHTPPPPPPTPLSKKRINKMTINEYISLKLCHECSYGLIMYHVEYCTLQ